MVEKKLKNIKNQTEFSKSLCKCIFPVNIYIYILSKGKSIRIKGFILMKNTRDKYDRNQNSSHSSTLVSFWNINYNEWKYISVDKKIVSLSFYFAFNLYFIIIIIFSILYYYYYYFFYFLLLLLLYINILYT